MSTHNSHMGLLDHGYVELVESWGSDERIIEAARMSTNKSFKGWGPGGDNLERVQRFKQTTGALRGGNDHPDRCVCQRKETGQFADTPHTHYQEAPFACARCKCTAYEAEIPSVGDEKLLRYLYEHKHMTPFEMGGLTIEVQAPIFVFREWHRHRTQSYNELSARYTPLPDVNYIPTVERLLMTSSKNKQAQGSNAGLTPGMAEHFQESLKYGYVEAERAYQNALFDGVPKELARLMIPVGRYSRMRASANLRNWLGFLTLRLDENAQWEIRQYATVVGILVAEAFPQTWKLFIEGLSE